MSTPRALVAAVALPPLLWAISLAVALANPARPRLAHGFRWLFLVGPGFDFNGYRPRIAFLHTPQFFTIPGYPWYYPAPCIFLYAPFQAVADLLHAPRLSLLSFEATSLLAAVAATYGFSRALARAGLSTASARLLAACCFVFSWPLYYALQRANVELLTWPILALGVVAVARKRYTTAAVLLGAAGAFKLYPLVCLGLLVAARRYREVGLALIVATLLTLAGLRFLEPSVPFAFHQIQNAVTHWTQDYAVPFSPEAAAVDHSGYELTKLLLHPFRPDYPKLERGYLLFAALLALGVFFGTLRHLSQTNQVLFLVPVAIFLPPASFDYTLLNLFIPFAWMALVSVQQARVGRRQASVSIALLLLGLLLGPETFMILGGLTVSAAFKGLLLLTSLILAATLPMDDLAVNPSGSRPDSR